MATITHNAPEPTTLALLGFGLIGAGYVRRRRPVAIRASLTWKVALGFRQDVGALLFERDSPAPAAHRHPAPGTSSQYRWSASRTRLIGRRVVGKALDLADITR